MSLTAEQVAFFKDNGYLIVPSVMDTQLCAEAQDMMWDALPSGSRLKREDASSHLGPFADAERSTDSLHTRDGYRWLLRSVGTSATVTHLVYSQAIYAMVEQLLGGVNLRRPVIGGTPMGKHGPAWPGGPTDPALGNEGARGIYFTLPYGDKPREPDRCHTDGHPFQLGIVGLLSEVPPDGGAFKVWPKSHRRLYPTFQMQYDQPRIAYYDHLPSYKGIVHTPEYLAELEKLQADTPAVECWGSPGDIVFWHHRTAHMAGHNYTNVIRQAVLADFWNLDLDQHRADPPQDDMWRDWSDNIRQSSTEYSAEFAKSQHLP